MKIEAKSRFNHHDPGEVFEASDADAEKWISLGFAAAAEEAGDEEQEEGVDRKPESKGVDKPPQDKAKKGAPVKK